MKALIEKILITERVRKEVTRIDELAADIKVNGLFHPITVMSVDSGEYRLLAGLRRVKAAQTLGWTEIDVNIVAPADAAAILNIEISENEQREPFTFSERDYFRKLLEEVERAKAKERMALGGKGGLEEGSPQGDTLQHGRVSSIVAGKLGMKKTTYDRAKYISENAPPEVIKQLDKGERTIRGTFDELKEKEKAKKAAEPSEPEAIETDEESDGDNQEDNGSDNGSESAVAATPTVNAPTVDPPKPNVPPAGVLSKADQEAEARNVAFNALSPQKKVVELQRQLKEERARAANAESELARLKELRHNDVFHKDGIINNLKTRLANAEARIKELEDKYCADYRKDENNHNTLVLDNYAAEIVRDIYRMKIEGYSSARIAVTLNERGVLSPLEYKKDRGLPHPKGGYADKNGAKWCATTIIRILSDEIYTGTLIQGKSGTPTYKLKELVQKPEDEWHRYENAHEAIILRHNFDLVQKIMRLDTRTAPKGDKVYLFSGILVCGCCGNRMTRKTVPYKGTKHYYYWCPTGKKNGCGGSVMLKENDLIDCVLGNIKAHIINIASLETLLSGLDATRIARELADKLAGQIAENEHRLDKVREYKASLYENMINGNLTKDEHKALKAKYAADSDTLVTANARLRNEIEAVLSCKHERMAWTGHFTKFEALETIDRKMVMHLIHSIRVLGKSEIEINFNYQFEYDNAVEFVTKEAV